MFRCSEAPEFAKFTAIPTTEWVFQRLVNVPEHVAEGRALSEFEYQRDAEDWLRCTDGRAVFVGMVTAPGWSVVEIDYNTQTWRCAYGKGLG